MALPEPILDNLRFQQDLVDEARRRIVRYCPDWTDYNVSDPGITLIELFAWMTELTAYRMNQVPEKNYIRFLDMLGVRLQPANSATADLTFRLSVPFPVAPDDASEAVVPQGTEVATRASEDEPEVIFTTDEKLVIAPPKITQLRRDAEYNRNFLPRMATEPFVVFSSTPRIGDTFYIGFEEQDVAGMLLKLHIDCESTQAVGIRRDNPPLVWECSLGNDTWSELIPSNRNGEKNTLGGLNNDTGEITFYLPLAMKQDLVHGRRASWMRCRFEQRTPEQGMYSQSPRITGVQAYVLGGTVHATNAVIVKDEVLGTSIGEAGQKFKLANAPVLGLRDGEHIEIEETVDGEDVFVPWTRVDDFSSSDQFDRHFTLDTASGEIELGPGVRQQDGSVRQYGRVPEANRGVRFSAYRHGGGIAGNVPAERITVLRAALPYIDTVINFKRATGGRDQEDIEEAKFRARREVRAQQRAVTAEDFEHFARAASRSVARARCNPFAGPQRDNAATGLVPGMVDLLIVPAAFDAVRNGDLSRLRLDESLQHRIAEYIDRYRLLTVTMRIREPVYIGVKVQADVVLNPFSKAEDVTARLQEVLHGYLSPLNVGGYKPPEDAVWDGWQFGRQLYLSELYSLIQGVTGVKHVRDVKLGSIRLTPGAEQARQIADVKVADKRVIDVPSDGLLCSLEHVIRVVTL